MSIRRRIEIVLDRAAAKRVERDTKRTLDRGTDPKKAKKNLAEVGNALGGLRSMALKLGAAMGAAFVARKIVQFGKAAVGVATEAAAVWARLAGQLRNAGVEFADVRDEIDSTARSMQDLTVVGDEDFAAVLSELVSITGDYAASLKEVQTVADLSAAKQIDLKTAAQLVGRAMVGQTSALSRYGIVVEEGADAMDVLRDRFQGMAANEGKTLLGMTERLSNEWSDFQQAIGDVMIAAGGGTSVLETLIGTVKGLTKWVTENRKELTFWGSMVVDVFIAAGKTVAGFAGLVKSAFLTAGSLINVAVTGWQLLFVTWLDFLMGRANQLIEGLNKLPGVDIDFRFNGIDVVVYEEQAKAAADDLVASLAGVAKNLVLVGEGWVDVGRKAFTAGRQQEEAASVVPGGDRTGGRGGVSIPDVERRKPESPDPLGDVAITVFDVTQLSRARELSETEMDRLRRSAEITAEGMTSAFQTFFDATATGFSGQADVFSSAGEAARKAGAAIVAGMVAGRVETEIALGTAALASGIWPPNPAAIASAGKHFAAATLFGAIPGVVGGGGGSGGGSSSAGGVGALQSSVPGATQPIAPEIHIHIDALSPADPRFQRVVLGATQNAQERFGENVKVNIHPRTGG